MGFPVSPAGSSPEQRWQSSVCRTALSARIAPLENLIKFPTKNSATLAERGVRWLSVGLSRGLYFSRNLAIDTFGKLNSLANRACRLLRAFQHTSAYG